MNLEFIKQVYMTDISYFLLLTEEEVVVIMTNAETLISLIIKSGLKKYKVSNSRYAAITHVEDNNKKGAVFGFRTKDQMTKAEGFVMTSKESVFENVNQLSHWTPNVYSWGGYTDKSRKYVRGHFEENLIQLNTFVLDIDCKDLSKYRLDYLLVQCMDNSDLVPTAIVETPAGYHLYFVLEDASYVSSANNYKSLRTAKAISSNLRQSFAELLQGVDVMCNHFGIFRMPTEENLVHFDEKLTYDFEDLMTWSMDYSRQNKKSLQFTLKLKPKKTLNKQINATWFKQLLTTPTIRGGKGQIGRNNALFTAALACYSSEMDKDACLDIMDEFNTSLTDPLPHREVIKIIKSAYSGKYAGAHSDAISELSALYLPNKAFKTSSKACSGRVSPEYWVKFAKERKNRERVHYSEWKIDLIDYINNHTTRHKPYLDIPRDTLIKELGIPASSLKDLLRKLKKTSAIYIQTKRGKGGFTKLATKKSIALTLLSQRYELFSHYKSVLARYFPDSLSYTTTIENMRFNVLRTREDGLLIKGPPG